MTEVNYQRYLASREWALLKRQVEVRAVPWFLPWSAGPTCERCGRAPMQVTHHLTYERLGGELLDDLAGLCRPCHAWVSARGDDPLAALVEEYRQRLAEFEALHALPTDDADEANYRRWDVAWSRTELEDLEIWHALALRDIRVSVLEYNQLTRDAERRRDDAIGHAPYPEDD